MKRAALAVVVVAMLAMAYILWPRDRPIVRELRGITVLAITHRQGLQQE